MAVGRLFCPDQRGEESGPQTRCKAHVRRRQSAVSKQWREQRVEKRRHCARRGAKIAPGPNEDHESAENEKWQIAETHEEERLLGMMLVGENRPSFILKIGETLWAGPAQIGQQG